MFLLCFSFKFFIPYKSVLPSVCVCVGGGGARWSHPFQTHMLLFRLSAMTTVSLEGLGNNVARAPLCSGELFSQLDRRLHSYVNHNCTLQNTVCLKRDCKASTQWWVLTKNDKRGRIRNCQTVGELMCHYRPIFSIVAKLNKYCETVNPKWKKKRSFCLIQTELHMQKALPIWCMC